MGESKKLEGGSFKFVTPAQKTGSLNGGGDDDDCDNSDANFVPRATLAEVAS